MSRSPTSTKIQNEKKCLVKPKNLLFFVICWKFGSCADAESCILIEGRSFIHHDKFGLGRKNLMLGASPKKRIDGLAGWGLA